MLKNPVELCTENISYFRIATRQISDLKPKQSPVESHEKYTFDYNVHVT